MHVYMPKHLRQSHELGLWMILWHCCYTVLIVCYVQVEELVRLSLNHPVRLFVDSNTDVADNLRQEFIRIKSKKEGDREAIVTGILCTFDVIV